MFYVADGKAVSGHPSGGGGAPRVLEAHVCVGSVDALHVASGARACAARPERHGARVAAAMLGEEDDDVAARKCWRGVAASSGEEVLACWQRRVVERGEAVKESKRSRASRVRTLTRGADAAAAPLCGPVLTRVAGAVAPLSAWSGCSRRWRCPSGGRGARH